MSELPMCNEPLLGGGLSSIDREYGVACRHALSRLSNRLLNPPQALSEPVSAIQIEVTTGFIHQHHLFGCATGLTQGSDPGRYY